MEFSVSLDIRQEAIDILLGKFQRGESLLRKSVLHETVYKELNARLGEYSSTKQVNFFLGTWNVNGKYSTSERLDNWLVSGKVASPHMYVIGIQELIELSPGAVRFLGGFLRAFFRRLISFST